MTRWGWIWLGLGAAALLVLLTPAQAQTDHGAGHAHYRDWVSRGDKGCCNDQDCGALAWSDERSTSGGGVEVRIEGQWCPVLDAHYLKRGNAPDWSTAHVCVRKVYRGDEAEAEPEPPCKRLLCYQPRPGT